MKHKVDYLSFTFYSEKVGSVGNYLLIQTIFDEMPAHIHQGEWKYAPKRMGFDIGFNFNNHTFVWASHQGLILVEHTGVGCSLLESEGHLATVIETYKDRLSRIDIATDIFCEASPLEFAEKREAGRISASGFQTSKTGETVYIGSKKSDRTAKVYRYNYPHPRHEWLRIEYTYRGEQARKAANYLTNNSLADLALVSAERYKWMHEDWKPAQNQLNELKAWRPERKAGKTVMWIYSQVIPAIAKLVKADVISLNDIIAALEEACGKDETKTQ